MRSCGNGLMETFLERFHPPGIRADRLKMSKTTYDTDFKSSWTKELLRSCRVIAPAPVAQMACPGAEPVELRTGNGVTTAAGFREINPP